MLHQKIKEDMRAALKAHDEVRLTTLRGALSAFTNELVAHKQKPDGELADDVALSVLTRLAKQRKDSIEQYEKGGRADLADNERAELKIIEEYLPQMMDKSEIEKVAKEKKEALGITDKKDMGRLMGAVMAELKGRADGGDVKEVVGSLLQ